MTNILKSFDHGFPFTEFPHALFYEVDHALRFELGGENVPTSRPIKRFNQALQRACTVAEAVFKNTNDLWLLTSYYGEKSRPQRRLKPLEICGLSPKDFVHLGAVAQHDADYSAEFGCGEFRFWDAVQLIDKTQLQEVLWLTLGAELGIRPSLSIDVYFVDFAQNLALHPYDDRGMDLAATTKSSLQSYYQAFNGWILDFNKPEIDARFGQG